MSEILLVRIVSIIILFAPFSFKVNACFLLFFSKFNYAYLYIICILKFKLII